MLKTFDEVFDDYTKYGTKIKTEQYETIGTNIIIDQGQSDIAGYTDQSEGLFTDVPVIVFGDHTRIIKYINRPFFLGADGTKILKSKIPDANYKYLYYALKNAKIPNTGYNRHFKWLKQISISYPEHEKQSMIVEILDKLEDSIDNYNTILGLLDKLVKARFIEMFGDLKSNEKDWNLKTFEEMSVLITDGEHSTPKRTKEGIYLLSARNVLNHSLQLKDVDYINRDEYLRIAKRVVPKKGDILISCSGTIGRCCSVPDSLQLQMVRSVALIRFKEVINPIFAEYMITSDYLQEQINSSKTMSSQANLFQGKIRKLKGFLPPTELQNQFADFVEQVDKSREAVKKSLEKTQQLYDSLMQEYFG